MTIYQVDAFTDTVFKGNPAAVVPLENWLPDETLQAIALENNLSETAFFVPQGDDFHLRWFTPAVEVDLCGHATLATAHVLFQHLDFSKEEIVFHARLGKLTVHREKAGYAMDFPADELKTAAVPKALLEGLKLNVVECYQGREDYLAVVASQREVEEVKPDFRLLATLPARGVILTARGAEVDFVSRCFFPQAGIDEDPVTGSAHTTLTPYWAECLQKTELTAKQLSKRGGFLTCHLKGERVELHGQAVTYMVGEIQV